MQVEANILERVARSYVAHQGVRLLCVLAVVGAALLLFVFSGGFPPTAWLLLARALLQTSALLAAHGQSVLLALFGLILIALSVPLAWWLLLWISWRMLAYWLYERREMREFAADLAEAEYHAEDVTENAQDAEFDEEEENMYQYTRSVSIGRHARPVARRKVIYPLTPLEPEEQDDPDPVAGALTSDTVPVRDAWWDEDMADEEVEAQTQAHDESLYPQGKYSSVNFVPALTSSADSEPGMLDSADRSPVPEADSSLAQPLRPVRLVSASAPVYDQQIIEHPGPAAASGNLQYSSYGRVLPFSVAPSAGAQPHLTASPYDRVPVSRPLPTTPPAPVTFLPTEPLPSASLSVSSVEPVARRSQPAIQLSVSTGLDVGLSRRGKPNEDSLLALQNTRVLRGCSCPVGLFVVADGMGGHENGQEASRLVIQSLSKTVVPSIIYGPTDDNYAELLAEGVHHANLEVYQRNRQARADMGTTIAAALVVDTTAYVVSAGDSRVYLYRAASGLLQVTRDHSTVARLVENGLIQPEDVYTHPRRNEIYRSLGHHPSEDLDKFILALQPEDILMLCSDGLWEMVRDAQIQQIIASTRNQPTQTSAALVQAALEGGGKDNISVIVVCVNAAQETQAAWAG